MKNDYSRQERYHKKVGSTPICIRVSKETAELWHTYKADFPSTNAALFSLLQMNEDSSGDLGQNPTNRSDKRD